MFRVFRVFRVSSLEFESRSSSLGVQVRAWSPVVELKAIYGYVVRRRRCRLFNIAIFNDSRWRTTD